MDLATIARTFLQQEGTGGKLNTFQLKVLDDIIDCRTSKIQDMELGINEFIRRFLLHVLPKSFVKIRHYGFMACRNKAGALGSILLQLGEKSRQSLKGLP